MSMCGLIAVDAESFRSSNLARDAYIHDHCLGYRHNYLLLYQFPNRNLFTHRMLFSREKTLVKSTAPGSIFYHIVFRHIFSKIQKYLAALFLSLFYFVFLLDPFANLVQFSLSQYRGWIDNPSYTLVASFCGLCAGVVYIVLLGSPTGFITLVS